MAQQMIERSVPLLEIITDNKPRFAVPYDVITAADWGYYWHDAKCRILRRLQPSLASGKRNIGLRHQTDIQIHKIINF